MGIYIEGMEIPKSCWKCPFHDEDYCYPGDMSISRDHHSDRSKYCPMIEVPDGHGRLIDADELIVHDGWLAEAECQRTHITFVYSNDLADAPTVIPAAGRNL